MDCFLCPIGVSRLCGDTTENLSRFSGEMKIYSKAPYTRIKKIRIIGTRGGVVLRIIGTGVAKKLFLCAGPYCIKGCPFC